MACDDKFLGVLMNTSNGSDMKWLLGGKEKRVKLASSGLNFCLRPCVDEFELSPSVIF